MSDLRDAASVLAAAEQAAEQGDYATAEQCLRDAAALQQSALGPDHPDLANTLNNLGVACERAGKLDDAEASYRRAYAIALGALPAGHPLLVRSEENLRDFCAALGRPFEPSVPTPPPLVREALPEAVQVASATTPSETTQTTDVVRPDLAERVGRAAVRERTPVADVDAAAAPRRHFGWVVPVIVILAIAAVVAWFVGVRPAPAADVGPAEPLPPSSLPANNSGTESEPGAPAPATGQATVENAPPAPSMVVESDAPRAVTRPAVPAAGDSVVRAEVCRNFSTTTAEWRCDAVGAATSPGVLVYFTRLRFPRPTTVVHRWMRDGALMQRLELRVGGNPREGYRTYSRQTVRPGATGEWRVELRDADGALLHEQQFVVQ